MNIFIYFNFGLCVLQLCATQHILRPVFMKQSAFRPRIYNGEKAKLGEIPYQVSFRRKSPTLVVYGIGGNTKYLYSTFCGGSIIKENKILSAAHCFVPGGSSCYKSKVLKDITSDIRAVAGTLHSYGIQHVRYEEGNYDFTQLRTLYQDAQWRELEMIIYPSRYRFPFYEDIAIVVLTEPFIFNENVNRIGYASRFRDYRGECLASGYGRLNETVVSNFLYKADIEMWTNYWCCMSYHRNMKELICTGSVKSNVEPGDSGGPLVCRGTGDKNEGPYGLLVGITSGGSPGKGSFFTRVSAYHDYITNNRAPQSYTSNCFMGSVVLLSIYGIYSKLIVVMTT